MVCCRSGGTPQKSSPEKKSEKARKAEYKAQNETLRLQNLKLREDLRAAQAKHKEKRPTQPVGQRFEFVRRLPLHDAPVHSVSVDPDKETIATGSWDATVKIYNIEQDEVIQTLGDLDAGQEGRMSGLYAVRFATSAPGVLGCASCNGSAYIWKLSTGDDGTPSGTLLSKLSAHTSDVNDLHFHPVHHIMCTVSDDSKALIWDFQEGIVLRTIDEHTDGVYGTVFLGEEDPYLFATCSYDRTARIFDMRDREVVQTLSGHQEKVLGVDYSPAKKQLVTGSDDGKVLVWDQSTWKIIHEIDTVKDTGIHNNEVKRVRFHPDGDHIAAACSTRRVLVYDVSSSQHQLSSKLRAERGLQNGHSEAVFDVAWGGGTGAEPKTLVSASHDHTCVYWREATDE